MIRVAFIGDTHIGSRTGLWPDKFECLDHTILYPSQPQMQLLEYFNDFWRHEAKDADIIIFLGDLCQGINPREYGAGCTTSKPNEQLDAAEQLLKPFIQDRPVYGVTGTPYHQAGTTDLDETLIKRLGGTYCGRKMDLRLEDKYLRIFHGAQSPWWYKAGAFEKYDFMLNRAIQRGHINHSVDIIASAHWHVFRCLQTDQRTFIKNPAWQLAINWHKISDVEQDICLGATVIDIGRNVVVHPRIYPWINTTEGPLTII